MNISAERAPSVRLHERAASRPTANSNLLNAYYLQDAVFSTRRRILVKVIPTRQIRKTRAEQKPNEKKLRTTKDFMHRSSYICVSSRFDKRTKLPCFATTNHLRSITILLSCTFSWLNRKCNLISLVPSLCQSMLYHFQHIPYMLCGRMSCAQL